MSSMPTVARSDHLVPLLFQLRRRFRRKLTQWVLWLTGLPLFIFAFCALLQIQLCSYAQRLRRVVKGPSFSTASSRCRMWPAVSTWRRLLLWPSLALAAQAPAAPRTDDLPPRQGRRARARERAHVRRHAVVV
eukprot:1916424-Pleurochrysis_carterae.AAC.3